MNLRQPRRIRRLHLRLDPAMAFTWGAMVACVVFFSWLAVLRHASFGTSALDLGYTTQAVWNTRHGRILQFSTLENARIDLPLSQFRRTDILLAYHVEPLLVPLSLLYFLWADPVLLLLVQVLAVTLGAWPVFLLARDHLHNSWAGLAFAVSYLLAPATEGAMLSDFHANALAAPLLLTALYLAHRQRYWACAGILVGALLTKEDVSLLVLMIGLYLIVVHRKPRVGLVVLSMGLGWFLLCTQIILPAYNGLGSSPFVARLAIFGGTPQETLQRALREPVLVLDWLRQPDIMRYLGGLLLSGGLLSLLSPAMLALAAPAAAINVFSTWSWTYSEGDHYSITLVPFVIVSAIYGAQTLAVFLERRLVWPRRHLLIGLILWLLVFSGIHHIRLGVSPLAQTYFRPSVTEHHRLGHRLATLIPAEASVSAQSNLNPHVAHRQQAYLYPAINEAEYVFLDVLSSPYPLTPHGLALAARDNLRSGEFGIIAAEDGYLILRRGASNNTLPEAFYTFTRPQPDAQPIAQQVRFDDAVELVGYEIRGLNLVHAQNRTATVVTYWRALQPLELDYEFPLLLTRGDGAIAYVHSQGTSTTSWYPAYKWPVGEVICMESPVLAIDRAGSVLVAVTEPGRDPWQAQNRLLPQWPPGEPNRAVGGGTLVPLDLSPANR